MPANGRWDLLRPLKVKIGTGQLRETTPTENHRSSRIAGGGHGADNPTPENYVVQKP